MTHLPTTDAELTAPHWAGAAEGRLLLPHCPDDGWFWPPTVMCPACVSTSWSWEPAPETGRVESFTVVERGVDPTYPVPFVLAAVEVDGTGVTLFSHLVDVTDDDLRCDLPVTVDFRPVGTDPDPVPVHRPTHTSP